MDLPAVGRRQHPACPGRDRAARLLSWAVRAGSAKRRPEWLPGKTPVRRGPATLPALPRVGCAFTKPKLGVAEMEPGWFCSVTRRAGYPECGLRGCELRSPRGVGRGGVDRMCSYLDQVAASSLCDHNPPPPCCLHPSPSHALPTHPRHPGSVTGRQSPWLFTSPFSPGRPRLSLV